MFVYVYECICMYVCVYACIGYISVCMRMYMHVYERYVHVFVHICLYAHVCIFLWWFKFQQKNWSFILLSEVFQINLPSKRKSFLKQNAFLVVEVRTPVCTVICACMCHWATAAWHVQAEINIFVVCERHWCIYMHIHTYTYKYISIHAYIYIYIWYMQIHTNTCLYAFQPMSVWRRFRYSHCLRYRHIHANTYIYVLIQSRMNSPRTYMHV